MKHVILLPSLKEMQPMEIILKQSEILPIGSYITVHVSAKQYVDEVPNFHRCITNKKKARINPTLLFPVHMKIIGYRAHHDENEEDNCLFIICEHCIRPSFGLL